MELSNLPPGVRDDDIPGCAWPPMTADAFMAALVDQEVESYALADAVRCWVNGDYDEALEYLA